MKRRGVCIECGKKRATRKELVIKKKVSVTRVLANDLTDDDFCKEFVCVGCA